MKKLTVGVVERALLGTAAIDNINVGRAILSGPEVVNAEVAGERD